MSWCHSGVRVYLLQKLLHNYGVNLGLELITRITYLDGRYCFRSVESCAGNYYATAHYQQLLIMCVIAPCLKFDLRLFSCLVTGISNPRAIERPPSPLLPPRCLWNVAFVCTSLKIY